MANIGDLLGNLDLSQFQDPDSADERADEKETPVTGDQSATEPVPAGEHNGAPSGADADAPDAPSSSIDTPLTPDEVTMAAVLQETALAPEDARDDLRLADPNGLDLDELQRFAITANIERDLRIQIPDRHVKAWETLGEMLSDVRTLSQK